MAEDTDTVRLQAQSTAATPLFRELQYTLYEIARQAELGSASSAGKIQIRAEQSLRLLDSWIITSQLEAGQLQLELSPFGVGSVLHEVAFDLRSSTQTTVKVETGVNQPVTTNAEMLKNLLFSAGNFIFDVAKKPVVLRSFPDKSGNVGVGVFAKGFDVTPDEYRKAIANSGSSYMPMARYTERSGVMLLLADSLARSLGSELHVKRLDGYKGFAAILPKSQQLSLIT